MTKGGVMNDDTESNNKSGALTLILKADSGYESEETHRISAAQWEAILRIIYGTDSK